MGTGCDETPIIMRHLNFFDILFYDIRFHTLFYEIPAEQKPTTKHGAKLLILLSLHWIAQAVPTLKTRAWVFKVSGELYIVSHLHSW